MRQTAASALQACEAKTVAPSAVRRLCNNWRPSGEQARSASGRYGCTSAGQDSVWSRLVSSAGRPALIKPPPAASHSSGAAELRAAAARCRAEPQRSPSGAPAERQRSPSGATAERQRRAGGNGGGIGSSRSPALGVIAPLGTNTFKLQSISAQSPPCPGSRGACNSVPHVGYTAARARLVRSILLLKV